MREKHSKRCENQTKNCEYQTLLKLIILNSIYSGEAIARIDFK